MSRSRNTLRRWPAFALGAGSVAAVVVALVGRTPELTAVAVLFVLSSVLLAALARRAYAPSAVAWRIAVAATVLAGALLVLLAEQAVVAVALTAVALLFFLLVALLGVLVAITTIADPAPWMYDDDGHLVGLAQRMRLAWQHWSRRALDRPSRTPERVLAAVRRDMRRMVWHAGTPQATAFPYFHVVLHPATAEALDGWMPFEAAAADLAQAYADAHPDVARKSSLVVVLISTDPEVPLGVGAVQASFRESHPEAAKARAWARLDGPAGLPSHGAGQRMVGAMAPAVDVGTRAMGSLAGPATLPAEAGLPDDDATVHLLLEDSDRTRIVPGPGAGVLTLNHDGREHVLYGQRAYRIGRGADADIRSDEMHVSRDHARIEFRDGAWVIEDRSSRGTFVNGEQVDRGAPATVRPGDTIELGRAAHGGQQVLLHVA